MFSSIVTCKAVKYRTIIRQNYPKSKACVYHFDISHYWHLIGESLWRSHRSCQLMNWKRASLLLAQLHSFSSLPLTRFLIFFSTELIQHKSTLLHWCLLKAAGSHAFKEGLLAWDSAFWTQIRVRKTRIVAWPWHR